MIQSSYNCSIQGLISWNMLTAVSEIVFGTRLESQMALDLGTLSIAEHKGKIIYTDTDKIILSSNGDTIRIPLVMYQRSNKNTCMH